MISDYDKKTGQIIFGDANSVEPGMLMECTEHVSSFFITIHIYHTYTVITYTCIDLLYYFLLFVLLFTLLNFIFLFLS